MHRFSLPKVFRGLWVTLLLLVTCPATSDDWSEVLDDAKGDTVYFYAWGGSDSVNRYLRWVDSELAHRYDIRLNHVKVSDIAEAVHRLRSDMRAGRDHGGAIDLVWINGENFHALKRDDLLQTDLLTAVPNHSLLLTEKLRLLTDFGVPVDGLEVPWGVGQFNLIARNNSFPETRITAGQLLTFARNNPGRLSYPKPPDFIGTTFLKSLLQDLTENDERLYQPADAAAMEQLLPILWRYLDQLHPLLWEQGRAFPQSSAQQLQWLVDDRLAIAFSFNPRELAAKTDTGQLPGGSLSQHYFSAGAITNSHYLAIPRNATHKAAARVVINFLISPQAQQRKANTEYWGDPAVIDLPTEGALLPAAAELHASWQDELESRWLARYQ